jgi:hypothetical protein
MKICNLHSLRFRNWNDGDYYLISCRTVTLTTRENESVPQALTLQTGIREAPASNPSQDTKQPGTRSELWRRVKWNLPGVVLDTEVRTANEVFVRVERCIPVLHQWMHPYSPPPPPLHTKERCWWNQHVTADLIFSSYKTYRFLRCRWGAKYMEVAGL